MDNNLGKDMVKELDFVTMYKMMFIYNAIQKGWTVKKVNRNDKDQFEFTNNKDEIIKNFYLDDFLKKFVESNMKFSSLLSVS
jgi:hypothetical protein|tara:strand:- start:75 stop:320 length:246 start_codon:yes stop_codon:yes gene_type:complete